MGRRLVLAIALGLAALGARSTAGAQDLDYRLEARLDLAAQTITGRVEIRLKNQGRAPLGKLFLHLYANRFQHDGDEVNDITRRYVYPRGEPDAGSTSIEGISLGPPDSRTTPSYRTTNAPGLSENTLLEVDLPVALPPGGELELEIVFSTRVPLRFGPFGVTEHGLVAVGGWYPYVAAVDADGAWHPEWPPPAARVSARVSIAPELGVALGEQIFLPGHADVVSSEEEDVRSFALVAYTEPELIEQTTGEAVVRFFRPAPRRASRIAPGPDAEERLRSIVIKALDLAPQALPVPPSLTVIQVPLRWNLTTPSDGPIVISDRGMEVHPVLEGFHAAQIAESVYAELLRPRVLACEPDRDQEWIQQGVAWELAERFLRAYEPEHRSVHDWIAWLDFFALVDRFESAPKVPFVQAFFENASTDDELRESVLTYAADTAPARLVAARLDRQFGDATVQTAVDDYLTHVGGACEPFARALETATHAPPEAVRSALAKATAKPNPPGPYARVDPSQRPRRERSTYQLVLDSADVEVSSSEFGVAALFLARRRHDYTKDLALNAFVTERSYGMRIGPRLHFGERNDPNTYRQELFAYYTLAGLDSGFEDKGQPELRNSGAVGGLGALYEYSNVYWFDNPTDKREFRIFFDWYDRALGGQYGFLRFGARARATTPLGSANTIGAIELLAGFEEETAEPGVPIQEQYSLGGQKAIRGIPVDDRLARNIGLVRLELRQEIYPEWDLNLFDALTYRRPQVRLFVDSGNVDDSAGRALDPGRFAVGGGIGVGILYDVLGFFPGMAYLEVATRLDRDQEDVQVLFGTRQAF